MPYQVVWPKCNVFSPEGDRETLKRGTYLPAALDSIQVENLATIGAVRFVDFAAAVEFVIPVETDTTTEPIVQQFVQDLAVDEDLPVFGLGEQEGFTELSAAGVSDVPPEALGADPSGPPAKAAPKSEWEAFAVSQGVSEVDAATMSKADLVAGFGR